MLGVQQLGEGILDRPQWLPPGYMSDESDPDILILRRSDGAFVAAFSARGATSEGVLEAVEKDRQEREQ